MDYFLIDYENTKVDGLNGITGLSENDKLCIFYSKNAETLTFGMHRRLNDSKAKIIYQKAEVETKNALDFQLSTYLGYIIKENSENQYDYYIVSKDKGFEALSLYWKKKKVKVSVINDIASKNIQKDIKEETSALTDEKKELVNLSTNEKSKKENNKELIEKTVSSIVDNKELSESIIKIINTLPNKQEIHNSIIKLFPDDHEKVKEIYKAIKCYL